MPSRYLLDVPPEKPPIPRKEPPPQPVPVREPPDSDPPTSDPPPDSPPSEETKDTKTGANTSNRVKERDALSDKIEDTPDEPSKR